MEHFPEAFALVRPWLDSLRRGVLLFDLQGQCAYANARAQTWLGSGLLSTELSALTQVLGDAGFRADGARAALWLRESEALFLTVESRPSLGTVVWLDESSPETAQRLKFLSIASHDIRGALANSRSFGSLLLHPKWNLDAKVRHGLQVVVRNVDRALQLSHEVLDSLRAESAPLDVDIVETPLRPLLEAARERARVAATEREVGVESNLDSPGLPATWPVDAARFAHVLDALFEHALERTPPHGACRLEISAEGDALTVSISDQGSASGLPAELFDRDRRVSGANKLDSGFRLSLARVEAQAMGASLSAQVQPEGALSLTLSLRRDAAQLAAGSPPPPF